MKICPTCRTVFHEDAPVCPADGASLLTLQSDDDRCGTVIDERYLVVGQLGAGGMGTVYRAWQFSTDRMVALKLLHADLGAHKNAIERFMREARVTAGLTNPHVVRVHDFGQLADGTAYMAMELIDGVPLDGLIDGPMDPQRAVELVRQICIALEEAHAQGLVHRDLKPGNIIVRRLADGGEFAQVLDFGIAKVLDETRTALTHENQNPGTPAYMSPEQARNDAVGPPSDLYALSVMLFEMLVGERPFTGTSAMSVLLQHVQAAPPSLKTRLPDLPAVDALDAVIQRGLAKQPTTRYASAAALRSELERLKSGEAPEALSNPPPALKEKKKFGFNMQALGCSVQLAVAVGALAFFVLPALRDDGASRFDDIAQSDDIARSEEKRERPGAETTELLARQQQQRDERGEGPRRPKARALSTAALTDSQAPARPAKPEWPADPPKSDPAVDSIGAMIGNDQAEEEDEAVEAKDAPSPVPKQKHRMRRLTPGAPVPAEPMKKAEEPEDRQAKSDRNGGGGAGKLKGSTRRGRAKLAASPPPEPASPAELRRALLAQQSRIRLQCGSGFWPLKVQIAADGSVQRAEITSPGRARHAKANCVLKLVRGLTLPAPGRPTPLKLTL